MLRRQLWLLVPLVFVVSVEAVYEDARCKCVCVDHSVPKVSNESSAEPKRSVYVKSISSDKCTCPIMLEDKSDLCPYCDSVRSFRSYVMPPQRTNDYGDLHVAGASSARSPRSGDVVERRGANAVVNRAREHQSRWKGRIEAQRDRVFNERTILN
ncbi:hypothetical protein TcWFU_005338 [Taenia crassiceps]|uniref:Secreted protein n=1 Tax=Taenia crassiceps TaxID=6207 RepID=A0ABR4Q214_9CEST